MGESDPPRVVAEGGAAKWARIPCIFHIDDGPKRVRLIFVGRPAGSSKCPWSRPLFVGCGGADWVGISVDWIIVGPKGCLLATTP